MAQTRLVLAQIVTYRVVQCVDPDIIVVRLKKVASKYTN